MVYSLSIYMPSIGSVQKSIFGLSCVGNFGNVCAAEVSTSQISAPPRPNKQDGALFTH
jgi:hypothetical protein